MKIKPDSSVSSGYKAFLSNLAAQVYEPDVIEEILKLRAEYGIPDGGYPDVENVALHHPPSKWQNRKDFIKRQQMFYELAHQANNLVFRITGSIILVECPSLMLNYIFTNQWPDFSKENIDLGVKTTLDALAGSTIHCYLAPEVRNDYKNVNENTKARIDAFEDKMDIAYPITIRIDPSAPDSKILSDITRRLPLIKAHCSKALKARTSIWNKRRKNQDKLRRNRIIVANANKTYAEIRRLLLDDKNIPQKLAFPSDKLIQLIIAGAKKKGISVEK